MADALRAIDANANRAGEALRTLEDLARFLLDDRVLASEAKGLRHELRALLEPLPELIWHRDTEGDVGTSVSTAAEMERADDAGLAEAAGHRAAEALRVIEELSKTLAGRAGCGAMAGRAEALRYRVYTLHQRVVERLGCGRRRQWRLCLLLTESACRRRWEEVLEGALAGGVDCVQVREKAMGGAALLERVRAVIGVCRPREVSVIVNDRLEVALAAGADGVHLGQEDLPLGAARQIVGQGLMVGISTTNLEQAGAAVAGGADYVGLGPMYESTTKAKPTIAGPAYLRAYVRRHGLAHLAIGGVTAARMPELLAAGVRGVAVCAEVAGAEDPEAAARGLVACFSAGGDSASG
ncbi:thiamine phosphate synthase [Mucisphaera calidilacus]|uniref:Thiamine-phosphate synthase n=1 Tax=Mucisphaera calidilacus TaxID=2527982 RepID=A0A518BZQ4_9BACT|nr:thiamine phosphate synthase [Mucisphaera calidilacus]QDU72439.1 Thiamine-phosphate synthase [Mucisphaera calidilacus]